MHLNDLLRGHVELLGELLRRGLATEILQHLPLDAGQLVDDLDHVHGDADRARLVSHRSGDGLPDPPCRIGREFVALGVVKLLDSADETEVALLNEVEEEHAAPGVALGKGDHEAQVGLEEVILGPAAILGDPLQIPADPIPDPLPTVESLLGEQPRLDALRQIHFLLGIEQGDLADLLEVVLHRISRRTGLGHLLHRLIGVIDV